MAIVTLTTDYGERDYYQAVLKGAILRQSPRAQIVDVSHQVNPFDIVNGAYLLKNCYKSFPQGSIHILCVNNSNDQRNNLLLLEEKGHFFIGFNNGIFSLVFEERMGDVVLLNTKEYEPFVFQNFLGRIVRFILDKKPLIEMGERIAKIKEVLTLQPVISQNEIRASISHIDHYGNAITNLHITLFENVCNDRPFNIYIKKNEQLSQMANEFGDASIGETLALFNDSGYLIIAINMGNAAELLSLKKDDILQLEFKS